MNGASTMIASFAFMEDCSRDIKLYSDNLKENIDNIQQTIKDISSNEIWTSDALDNYKKKFDNFKEQFDDIYYELKNSSDYLNQYIEFSKKF